MTELAVNVKKLVYTAICVRCILELANSTDFYKYLKLFSYLLIICICCNVVASFLGLLEASVINADQQYEIWMKEWGELMNAENLVK